MGVFTTSGTQMSSPGHKLFQVFEIIQGRIYASAWDASITLSPCKNNNCIRFCKIMGTAY